MSVRHSVADFLRSRGFEMEPNPGGSLHVSLLNNDNNEANDFNDVDLDSSSGSSSNVPPPKVFHGHIRLKSSDKSDATEDSTEEDDDIYMYQQFDRHNTADVSMVPFQDHECLSPAKPSAKVLVFLMHFIDLTLGVFLIVRSFIQMRDDYGKLITSMILGLLLLSASVAGICLHTPLNKYFENRSLTMFNIAFGFISFAIYYVLSLLILTSMATMSSFVGTELDLSEQFTLCILGFTLSVGEVYKIIYTQYHYFSGQEGAHARRNFQNNNEMIDDTDDVENANAIPSVLFV